MKLEIRRKSTPDEYRCELTKELDLLAGLTQRDSYNIFYHYIFADSCCKKEKCLAIRVPGGTVGDLWIDDNNVITKIVIDTDYVIKTYPNDVNDMIQRFIGETIEFA